MTPPRDRPGRRLGWFAIGITIGAGLTLALIGLGVEVVRGDAPRDALAAPTYVEESATSGVDHSYRGGFNYFVGGGVAVFDCSGDRKPELYLAGGSSPAALYLNVSALGAELRFTRVPHPLTDLIGVTGAYPLDLDSDGITDLAVLRLGENVMLRGLGNCTFETANQLWGIDGGEEWTAAFSAKWEEGSAMPTLAFGNYVDLDQSGERPGECSDSYVFQPSDGSYARADALTPGWCTLSILFSDWDRSGRRDLRMTNDRHYYVDGEDQLWRVPPDEAPSLYSRDDGWDKLKIWGMGIASQDISGDGYPEIYLTSQGDNKLQTLAESAERPTYSDIALQSGANAHRPFIGDSSLPSTAWHAEFDDVNNDGFTDLFVSKGNVDAMPEFASEDPNNLLLGQPGGTFVEGAEAAGILDFGLSRGASVADLNLDGLLDLVVVNREGPVRLWRNLGAGNAAEGGAMGNWLMLRLDQDGANPDGIGSWVEVRLGNHVVERELVVGGGHAGGELGWLHFGLADASSARIRVRWPDGELGRWETVDANQFLIIGRDTIEPWVSD